MITAESARKLINPILQEKNLQAEKERRKKCIDCTFNLIQIEANNGKSVLYLSHFMDTLDLLNDEEIKLFQSLGYKIQNVYEGQERRLSHAINW